MKTKTFDAVELQHRGGEAVRRETAGMTLEEELAYWREGTKKLRELQETMRREKRRPFPWE